ncbi:MAG TPA: SMP-30/gluconolactonase/LRE family protein [Ktedonobacterales bacterium]|nr:SMP-30/gluconolactonase/LRE family protein [Ktedonobacterales bacterium]
MSEPHVLLSGLVMGEAPRWHVNRLWYTDLGAREVRAVDLDGQQEVVARVPSLGLGFLPDGRLLIVSMRDGLLLRREPDGSLVTHADLTSLSRRPWNDLVVDGRANAYVDNIGFEFPGGQFAPAGIIALVTPDGTMRQVADGLAFPNGMAVTPDNATLIVAESYGARLLAFDIAADGSLAHRRVWANLDGAHPDGICLDAEGAVWYADVPAKRCVRVREGGETLQTVELDRGCFACTLGGTDQRTLFIVAAEFPAAATGAGTRTGQIVAVEAPAPSAGWP